MLGKIRENDPDAPPVTPEQRESLTDLEQQIYGAIHAVSMPPEMSIELMRQKLNIPAYEWENPELYPADLRGKIAAGRMIQNQLELIERYHSIMKRNAEKAKNKANQKQKSASTNRNRRNKKPRITNRYRSRR